MSSKLFGLIAAFLFCGSFAYAQSNYDAGYIINNKGERIECLIKNREWNNNNLQECRYKLEKKGKVFNAGVNDIKAFQIYGYAKHERFIVDFKKTPSRFTDIRTFKTETDTVFLLIIVEGNPSLMAYDYRGVTNFFYTTPDNPLPVSLVYNESFDGSNLYKYLPFWDQLKTLSRNCPDIDSNQIRNIAYTYAGLTYIFTKINKCNKTNFTVLDKPQRELFKIGITLTPGISQKDVIVDKFLVYYGDKVDNLSLGNKSTFRFGAEFVLYSEVFKSWSMFIEPAYEHYGSSDKVMDANHGIALDFNYVDIGMGLRYKFNIGESFHLFANAVYVPFSFQMKSGAYYYDTYTASTKHSLFDFKINTNRSFALGLGAQYRRFGLEARYYFTKSIFEDAETNVWECNYKRTSLIARFNIL